MQVLEFQPAQTVQPAASMIRVTIHQDTTQLPSTLLPAQIAVLSVLWAKQVATIFCQYRSEPGVWLRILECSLSTPMKCGHNIWAHHQAHSLQAYWQLQAKKMTPNPTRT